MSGGKFVGQRYTHFGLRVAGCRPDVEQRQQMTDTENIHLLQDELNSLEATTDLRRNIVVLNKLAWLISDNELNRANALSETAYALAESLGDDEPDGRSGKAYSLRTQGYINMRLGNYTLAL